MVNENNPMIPPSVPNVRWCSQTQIIVGRNENIGIGINVDIVIYGLP